jgi:hypothetical protein
MADVVKLLKEMGRKVCAARVVSSRSYSGMLSLRGPKGLGDNIRYTLQESGFEDGDEVVLISKKDLTAMAMLHSTMGQGLD